jgi:hypothetical protein
VRIAALEASKSSLSGFQGSTALSGKAQGIMPSGGEEEVVASTTISSGLLPGGEEKYVISLAISGEPSSEVNELPCGGEEDVVSRPSAVSKARK